jgi:hypothetical protein
LKELQRSQSEDHAGIFGSDVEESIDALLHVSHPTDVDQYFFLFDNFVVFDNTTIQVVETKRSNHQITFPSWILVTYHEG